MFVAIFLSVKSQVIVYDALKILLPPGSRFWIDAVFLHMMSDLLEIHFSRQHFLRLRCLPPRVALIERSIERVILDHFCRGYERARAGVHASDMRMKQILRIDGLPPDFGIESKAAGGNSAGFYDVIKCQRQIINAHGELICIPPQELISAIDVD